MCAATSAAVISAAVMAAGTLVELDSEQFVEIANRLQKNGAFIIHGKTGLIHKKETYIVGNQGIILYCRSESILLSIKADIETKRLSLLL